MRLEGKQNCAFEKNARIQNQEMNARIKAILVLLRFSSIDIYRCYGWLITEMGQFIGLFFGSFAFTAHLMSGAD